jgi:hypothetical protein
MEQFVVRAGLAEPYTLIAGTRPHRDIAGLSGFSVQSAPGISINDLARAGLFPHLQISVTTLDALRRHGFDLVFPTPGAGLYHATVRVHHPMPTDVATQLSALFTQRPNPYPVPRGSRT